MARVSGKVDKAKGPTEAHRRLFAVVKGDMDRVGDARKFMDLDALTRFASKVSDTRVRHGRHVIFIDMQDTPGDVEWVERNVTSYVDYQKATTPDEAERVSDMLVERFKGAGGHSAKMGTTFVRYHLERMYMRYDEWRDDDGKEEDDS